jgi:3-hydroxyacyl-[acyl-carrier-protein] dehydratase
MSGFKSPADYLPHRPPFLLVDEILELVPGQSIVAQWTITGDEWFLPGHFPGRPIVPGVLQAEALAQASAIAVLSDERYAHKLPLFGGIDGARFRRQVVPGDVLRLEAQLTRMSGRAGKGTGKASVNGDITCEADMMFVLADR